MSDTELKIAISVDAKDGTLKIRELGEAGKDAGDQVDQGMRKGGRSMADFNITAAGAGKALGVVVAAAAAATAAIAALVAQQAQQAREMENLARLADTARQDFEGFAYATNQVGVSAENLADISKDVKDKLGDFIATGGGEFADFFENIAPKVGVTAEELAKLSGPEVLVAVKKAMDDANVSAAEQVFYLESIGNDASRLIPLLEDEGKALKEQAERAKELGIALDDIEHQRLLDAQKATDEWAGAFEGLKKQVAAEFAPLYTSVMSQAAEWTVKLQDKIVALAKVMVDVITRAVEDSQLAFILLVDKVMGSWITLSYGGKEAALIITSAFGIMADDVLEIVATMLEAIASRIEGISFTIKNPFGEDWDLGFEGAAATLSNQAENLRNASTATEDFTASITRLSQERQRDLAIHEEVIGQMVDEVLIKDQATTATETLTEKTSEATSALSNLGDQGELTADQLGSINEALDAMFAKEAADAIAQKEEEVAARLKLESDLTDKIKQLTLSTLEYKKWALEREVAALREAAGDDQQLQDKISQYRIAKLGDFETASKGTTEVLVNHWEDFSESTKDVLHDLVEDGIKLEFDSIKDAAKSLGESVVDIFSDMTAKILSNWAASGIMGLFSGQGLSGFTVDNLTSGWSASSAGSSGSNPVGTVASLGSTAYQAYTGEGVTGAVVEGVSNYLAGQQSVQYGVTAGQTLGSGTTGATGGYLAGQQTVQYGVTGGQTLGSGTVGGTSGGAGAGSGMAAGIGIGSAVAAAATILYKWSQLDSASYAGIDTGVGDNRLHVLDRDDDGQVSQWEVSRDMYKNIDDIEQYSTALATLTEGYSESGREAIGAATAHEDLQEALERSQLEIETMANVFGDQTAQMAFDMDGTIPSFKGFASAIAGHEVSLQDATRYHWLASEAAQGTAGATSTLYNELLALTGSAETAQTATMGMIASINELSSTPLNIDVQVNEHVITSTSSTDSRGAWSSAVSADNYATSTATGVSSDRWSIDYNTHAVGGIYTKPTLLADAFGAGHQVAEAGYSEAILPLRYPDQINKIEDKLDEMSSSSGLSSEDRAILKAIAVYTQKTAKILQRFEYSDNGVVA